MSPSRSRSLPNILAMTALFALFVVVYRQLTATYDFAQYTRIITRLYQSATVLLVVSIAKSIVEFLINRNVRRVKFKRYVSKVISAVAIAISVIAVAFIWIEDRETFTTYFGFVTIAIAVSFQDLFRNLVGSIVINTTRNVEIGDSLEIAGHIGQVVDVGFLYTTLLETRTWDDVAEVNNKEIKLPNQIFSNQIAKSYDVRDSFIWDEIIFTLHDTSRSLVRFEKTLLNLVREELRSKEQPSKQFLKRLNSHLVGASKNPYPVQIYFQFAPEGVQVAVRYLVSNGSVREVRSRLTQRIHKKLQKREDGKSSLDK